MSLLKRAAPRLQALFQASSGSEALARGASAYLNFISLSRGIYEQVCT